MSWKSLRRVDHAGFYAIGSSSLRIFHIHVPEDPERRGGFDTKLAFIVPPDRACAIAARLLSGKTETLAEKERGYTLTTMLTPQGDRVVMKVVERTKTRDGTREVVISREESLKTLTDVMTSFGEDYAQTQAWECKWALRK